MQHKNWPHSVYTCSCCCGHPKHHPPYHWTTEPLHYTTHLTSPTVDCLEVLLGSCATHWIRVWFKTNQGGHVIVAAFVARSPVLHFEVQTFCNSFCIMPLKPSTHPHTTQSLLLPGPLNANTSFGHLKRKELSISAEMANQLWPRTPTKSPNCFGHKRCSVSVHSFGRKSYSWPNLLHSSGKWQKLGRSNGYTRILKMQLVFSAWLRTLGLNRLLECNILYIYKIGICI